MKETIDKILVLLARGAGANEFHSLLQEVRGETASPQRGIEAPIGAAAAVARLQRDLDIPVDPGLNLEGKLARIEAEVRKRINPAVPQAVAAGVASTLARLGLNRFPDMTVAGMVVELEGAVGTLLEENEIALRRLDWLLNRVIVEKDGTLFIPRRSMLVSPGDRCDSVVNIDNQTGAL